ncbi:MAG: polysaccharide deacetylase family protein [Phycisphaeraceae bacterium]|nr:polysaccharide deacetylase family protein [Phycisphaeraceae bacterium]
MASIVFYFEVHQPHRLKKYTVFDEHPFYFDDDKNRAICEKVADKCYRPTTRLILDLVLRHEGNFRVSYSITGTVLDQMERYCPDVIELLGALAATGCCEFLSETYFHSLSFLYSREEFRRQIDLHTKRIQGLFGQTPRVFRDTELIYNNDVAAEVASIRDDSGAPRFLGTLCEGVDRILGYRSPNFVYRPPGDLRGPDGRPFGVLLKNYRLSDDIAFRFSNKGWSEWPLSAEKFATWVDNINGDGYLCNLFMDYETFGEHQWADTGIFHFLEALPPQVFDINPGQNHFITPSEALRRFDPVGVYDVPSMISWADTERDLSAWLGNAMQHNAIEELYRLEGPIREHVAAAAATGDARRVEEASHLYNDWRKLTTSDHFYYMCTKYWADGDVHKYFSPYDSPYDGYINFMNVLDNLRRRVEHAPA